VETVVLSARSAEALERATDRLADHLHAHRPDLADTAYTLARGRHAFPHRRIATGQDVQTLATALLNRDTSVVHTGHTSQDNTPVVFLFSGQGAQQPGMTTDLYHQEPFFRTAVDECAELLRPVVGADIRTVIFGNDAVLLNQTRWAQPALFTVEYALAALWMHWGVVPGGLLGHSVGEWVAACVGGVFSLGDALSLVALRGELMQRQVAGEMVTVVADRAAVEEVLVPGVSLAAHNGPRDCVVSGSSEAIERFVAVADDRGWTTQPVVTSHAFHSALMEPMIDEFVAAVAATPRSAPNIPFVSNVTGRWITDEQATDPDYWGRHVLGCVEFMSGLQTVTDRPDVVVLEVGPGRTLTSLVRRMGVEAKAFASLPHRRDSRTSVQTVQQTLGELWLNGVTPDWASHHDGQRRRIPLPTYPFTRKRYWLDRYVPQDTVRYPPGPHPLLDRVLLRSMDQSVFLTEFSLERHWVLAEHKLLGAAIVPGTTYLEMARAAAATHSGLPVTELRDVTFLVPLLVPEEETRSVHTTVRERDNGWLDFHVASHDPAGDRWTLHAQGTVGVVPLAEPAPRCDMAWLRERCALESVDVGVRQAEHKLMDFGDRWVSGLRTVHIGVRAALGPLDLPQRYRSECSDHVLHPALLDLATGFGGFAVLTTAADRARARTDRGFFLPVGYDSLRVHGPLPATGLSFVEPHPGYDPDSETRKVDVLICDEAGVVAVEINGFTTKRVTDAAQTVARLRPRSRHHTLRWIPLPPVPHPRQAPSGSVLVVGEPGGIAAALGAALRSRDLQVTEAELATVWSVDGANRYHVPPTPEGFGRLLGALDGRSPDELVHVAALVDSRAPLDPATLAARLDNGVHSLFHLTRALADRGVMPRRITVVAPSVAAVTGNEVMTAAVHATLFGLAKVIGSENQETEVLCVDIAEDTDPAAVCAELLGDRAPATVALRDGTRYVAELGAVDLREQPAPTPIGPGAVYLITGGLGGLGLAVARHLCRTVPGVRVALVSRTELPPPERWGEIPATDAKRLRQVGVLRELMDSGADVRCYSADVTDAAAMAAVVEKIRREWGTIGCVVHAAGVAGDGFLFRKDAETFRRVLAPKVIGAAVLDLVTRDAPPACMINFGSTVSVFGAAGQGDYTAANSYLDHFAAERAAAGRRTVTVDWSDWLDTGMAFDHGVTPDQGFFKSLSVLDALLSFDDVLASACPLVIVGEINYPRLGRDDGLAELLRHAPIVLSAPIQQAVTAARQTTATTRTTRTDGVPTLSGRPDGEYSRTERELARIWAGELGVTALNVHDNSFALGVDSLVALRLAQSIQKTLDVHVSMADMFRYVTVAELAAHLDGNARSVHHPSEEGGPA
jgi:acyl transferase domain-containing protein/acyl carrier protein